VAVAHRCSPRRAVYGGDDGGAGSPVSRETSRKTGWLRAALMKSSKGASGDSGKVRRRTNPPTGDARRGPKTSWSTVPGDIRGQLHNLDHPTTPAVRQHALACRAEVAHPIGALLAVGRDQETATGMLEQVHRGYTRLPRLAASHGEQGHRTHGFPCTQQSLDDPGDSEKQGVVNVWSSVGGRLGRLLRRTMMCPLCARTLSNSHRWSWVGSPS
jgi:hypothetical protein